MTYMWDWTIVFLGRGGTVFEYVETLTGPSTSALAAAVDQTGDGNVDLVYRAGNTAWIRPGDGTGRFQPVIGPAQLSPALRGGWRSTDLNGDGRIDFVDFDRESVRTYEGRVDGSFAALQAWQVPSWSPTDNRIAVGDFDGDGQIDAFEAAYDSVARADQLHFFWAIGTDTPQHTAATLTGCLPSFLDPADIDGDGSEELVGVCADELVVVTAHGREAHVGRRRIPGLDPTWWFQAAGMSDLDLNGHRDLVFASRPGVGVLWQDAEGSFGAPTQFLVPTKGTRVTLIDLNGDSRPDVATQIGGALFGSLGRRLDAPGAYSFGITTVLNAYAADFDGDGTTDIVADGTSSGVSQTVGAVLLGDGEGGFRVDVRKQVGLLLATGDGLLAGVGDFDRDGRTDLALRTRGTGGQPRLLFGDGTGDFSGGGSPFGQPSADVQADSLVLMRSRTARQPSRFFAVRGQDILVGTVSPERLVQLRSIYQLPGANPIFAADGDGDGEPELFVLDQWKIRILAEVGANWDVVAEIPWDLTALEGVAGEDLDADGDVDIVAWAQGRYEVLLASGAWSYVQTHVANVPSSGALSVDVSDFDHDGLSDLVMGCGSFMLVDRNVGLGRFERSASGLVGGGSTVLAWDTDQDGYPDVVNVNAYGAMVARNVSLRPRLRVAVVPSAPRTGQSFAIVVHAIPLRYIGVVRILYGATQVFEGQPNGTFATVSWTAPVLGRNVPVLTILYEEEYAPVSEELIALEVSRAPRQVIRGH